MDRHTNISKSTQFNSALLCSFEYPKNIITKVHKSFSISPIIFSNLLIQSQMKNVFKSLTRKCFLFQLSTIIKSNGIVARFCSSAPQPKSSKLVGYWLLGCSGMVFTAVVLGMAAGYLIVVYMVCYVIDLVVSTTNGSK